MLEMCRLQCLLRKNCRVRMPEMLKACERLNERDRELFFSDVRRLDWDDYFMTYWRGIRAHVLKELPDDGNYRERPRSCPFFRNCSSADTTRVAADGCRCPCKCSCKCPCVCLISMVALAVLAYYFFSTLFF